MFLFVRDIDKGLFIFIYRVNMDTIPVIAEVTYLPPIKQNITQALESVVDDPSLVEVDHPADPSHGDWSCNYAMRIAGKVKKDPREIADDIVQKLEGEDIQGIKDIQVAKGTPFINFTVDWQKWNEVGAILVEKDSYGTSSMLKGKKIMVEYAHPNVFKAFHIGHLRNIILGESVIRLLENQSAEIIRTNYQGDVGMHIAKAIWAFSQVDPADYPPSADERAKLLGTCYVEGSTAFEENQQAKKEITAINKKIYSGEDEKINELWERGKKWSLDKFQEIYDRVYSSFERQYMESEAAELAIDKINEALEKNILKEDDNAVIFDGKKQGLDTRVFLNSEGLPTYEGKDLGLAYLEFSDWGNIDLCIHIVAVEQISYFKVIFKVLDLLDPKMFKDKQYHYAYEFVGLKSGKMSSRKGKVVLGEDVLDEAKKRIEKIASSNAEDIAVGAVKFSFLKISAFKYLSFDFDESLNFEGFSGPYLQYTYARAQSILKSHPFNSDFDLKEYVLNDEERAMVSWLSRFKEVVGESTSQLSPHYLCEYVFELAQRFNSFYKKHSVLQAQEDHIKEIRIKLTAATAQVIKNSLNLLGIKVVDHM